MPGESVVVALTNLKGQQSTVVVHDLSGAVVFEQSLVPAGNKDQLVLNLGQRVTAGIYLVTVTTGEQRLTNRLVVR